MTVKELLEQISVLTEVSVENLFKEEYKGKVFDELKTLWDIWGEGSMFYKKEDVFIPMAKVTGILPKDLFKPEIINITFYRLKNAPLDEDVYNFYKEEVDDNESLFDFNEKCKKRIEELIKRYNENNA